MNEPEDVSRQEKNIARCFLFKNGDTGNQCILTSQRLKIIHRKKEYVFSNRVVGKIVIERKKTLLPLLTAGIAIPLIFIAFMEFSLSPLPTVLLMLTGAFVFYLGWNGSEVLGIYVDDLSYFFPFRQDNEGVKRFVSYATMMFRGFTGWELCYFIPLKKIGEKAALMYYLYENHDHLEVFDYNGFVNNLKSGEFEDKDVVFIFDPVNSPIRIQHVEGPLNTRIKAFFPDHVKLEDFRLITSISDFRMHFLKTLSDYKGGFEDVD